MTTCADCGMQLKFKQIAHELKIYVRGTAGTRVRRVAHYCADCHSANEYQSQVAREAYAAEVKAEILASLSEDQRAAFLTRLAARSA